VPKERIVVEYRAGFLLRREHRLSRALALFGLLLVWELLSESGVVPSLFLPSPISVGRELLRMLLSGELVLHIVASMKRLLAGFLLGAFAGIAIGVAVGFFSLVEAIGQPLIAAAFPVPKIAALPLLILWLGIGESSKIAVIVLGVVFPIAISTYTGVRQADAALIRAAISFGAGRWSLIRKVIMPSAMPNIFGGLRLGAGTALLVLVAAEMIGAERGIGFLILQAGNLMETTKLMAGMVVLSLLGLLSHSALAALERIVIPWRHT
jgi:NitT/TauT family transport system permease protein